MLITKNGVGLCIAFSLTRLQFILSIPYIGMIGTDNGANLFVEDKTFRFQLHRYIFTLLLRFNKEYRLYVDFRPMLFGELLTEIIPLGIESVKNSDGIWVLEKHEVVTRYSRLSKEESRKIVFYFKDIPEGIARATRLEKLCAEDAITAITNYYKVVKLLLQFDADVIA